MYPHPRRANRDVKALWRLAHEVLLVGVRVQSYRRAQAVRKGRVDWTVDRGDDSMRLCWEEREAAHLYQTRSKPMSQGALVAASVRRGVAGVQTGRLVAHGKAESEQVSTARPMNSSSREVAYVIASAPSVQHPLLIG